MVHVLAVAGSKMPAGLEAASASVQAKEVAHIPAVLAKKPARERGMPSMLQVGRAKMVVGAELAVHIHCQSMRVGLVAALVPLVIAGQNTVAAGRVEAAATGY